MENKDLELRKLYQKTLEGLLLIDDFSIDYFSLNRNIRELVINFLQKPEFNNARKTKKELLEAVQKIHLDYVSDEEVLYLAEYSNTEYCEYILSDYYSFFSDLAITDKKILAFVDLCCNSKLRFIFQSKTIPFYFDDFYHLVEYTLNVTEEEFKETMAKAEKLDLIVFNESRKKLETTKNFNHELLRLSTIPSYLYNLDVTDFVVSGYDCRKPLSELNFIAFAGDDVKTFIYSKLKEENVRFWYVGNFAEGINVFQYLKENNLNNSECVWLSYREAGALKEESLLIKRAEETDTTFILSGTKNELLGRTYSSVALKDSAIGKKAEKIFPAELTQPIHDYLERIISADKKREFISELYQKLQETNIFYMKETLSDFFTVFKQRLREDEFCESKILSVIDEEDFIKRYGSPGGQYSENLAVNERIKEIHRQLSQPLEYLKADKNILYEAEKLLAQHPNILNKEALLSSLKNAILFDKNNIIKIEPLLFVGSPGCGKSLLCRQLREIFKQDNDCFIAMGNGGGVQNLLGATPEWKGASNGRVLGSIWEANKSNCLGNPIIVLDELDKASFSIFGSDNFQNVLPVMLQLTGDENRKQFRDLFFEVPIKRFYPNIICTANSLEPLKQPNVESLLNRLCVIQFRDYTAQEMKDLIIPLKYEAFKNDHNDLVPEKLTAQETELIFEMCNGQTRQITLAVKKYLSASFDFTGKRHKLSSEEIEKLIKTSKVSYEEKQIGFCR